MKPKKPKPHSPQKQAIKKIRFGLESSEYDFLDKEMIIKINRKI